VNVAPPFVPQPFDTLLHDFWEEIDINTPVDWLLVGTTELAAVRRKRIIMNHQEGCGF
jgi:hypothetical protein